MTPAKSLSDLLISDTFLPRSNDASQFTQELERTFLNHKMHLQSLEVIKLWIFVFLYNLPSLMSSSNISKGYLEVIDGSFKLFYIKNYTSDVINIATFTFGQEQNYLYPESDEKICSISGPSLAKVMADKYTKIELIKYKILLVQRMPLILVSVEHKCTEPKYSATNTSVALFEPIKIEPRWCTEYILSLDTLNDQIVRFIEGLFELSRPRIITATGFPVDSPKFLLTSIATFFMSQTSSKFGNVRTELQINHNEEFEGLWVQIDGSPLIFFEYSENNPENSTLHRLAPYAAALINEAYLKYEIFHQKDTFMLKTQKHEHGLDTSTLENVLFLFPDDIGKLVESVERDLFIAFRNLPSDLDMFHFFQGRIMADKSNTQFYDLYTDGNSCSIVQLDDQGVKFCFTNEHDEKLELGLNAASCFNEKIIPHFQINISVIATKNIQRKLTFSELISLPKPNIIDETETRYCTDRVKPMTLKFVLEFYYLNAHEFFTNFKSLGKSVHEIIRLTKVNFQQAKSIILGALIGMFPAHSFVEKTLLVHNSADFEIRYQVEFETTKNFADVKHTVNFWQSYVKRMNLTTKIYMIFIVLDESDDKFVILDSIYLQVDPNFPAKHLKFMKDVSDNDLQVLSLENLPLDLIIDNKSMEKSELFHIKNTISFARALNYYADNQDVSTNIHKLIVYSQLGANIAFGIRGKLSKFRYHVRTDYFDKMSQLRNFHDKTSLKDLTIVIPDYIMNKLMDKSIQENVPEIPKIPNETLTTLKPAFQLISSAEKIGFIDFEVHINKVSLVNGQDPANVDDSSIKNTWQAEEVAMLTKTLARYDVAFDHVKFLTVTDVHGVINCREVKSSNDPQSGQICTYTAAKSQHTMIDMNSRICCKPDRSIRKTSGIKIESFKCSDDNSTQTNVDHVFHDGFVNENMFSVSKTHSEKSTCVFHLSGKMSAVFGKNDNSNIFIASEGFVTVIGGKFDDVFVLPRYHDNVHGFFDGKAGRNTLLILFVETWFNDNINMVFPTIVIDAESPKHNSIMKIYKKSNPKEVIRLLNIQNIIGRERKRETLLNATCQLEYIELKGGNAGYWDEISIGKTAKNCPTGLTIILDSLTELTVDARQNRLIEYVVNSGPVKICVNNAEEHSVLGLVVVKSDFQEFDRVKVEFENDNETRNVSLYLNSNEAPHVLVFNVKGQVQIKFNDHTLILDNHKHVLLKNTDLSTTTWKLKDKIITYTVKTGSDCNIFNDLFSLDEKTMQNTDYYHTFKIRSAEMNSKIDFQTNITLDQAQSSLTNVLDLRQITQDDIRDKLQISFLKSTDSDQYDEVVAWLPSSDAKNDDPNVLANLYLSVTRKSQIYVITDTRLLKLTTNYRFEDVYFAAAKNTVLVLDEKAIVDVYFGRIVNKLLRGKCKMSRSHGNLMIKKECDVMTGNCDSITIIFWNYDKNRQLFDKIGNLHGRINL